jgi:hypothetical protein
MAEAIYLLCAVTSVACARLLFRSWNEQRERLLLWSAGCFGALALSNCILFLDLVVFPGSDLLILRNVVTLAGVSCLMVGLIWETR